MKDAVMDCSPLLFTSVVCSHFLFTQIMAQVMVSDRCIPLQIQENQQKEYYCRKNIQIITFLKMSENYKNTNNVF